MQVVKGVDCVCVCDGVLYASCKGCGMCVCVCVMGCCMQVVKGVDCVFL